MVETILLIICGALLALWGGFELLDGVHRLRGLLMLWAGAGTAWIAAVYPAIGG